jgi:hypothetical protein
MRTLQEAAMITSHASHHPTLIAKCVLATLEPRTAQADHHQRDGA